MQPDPGAMDDLIQQVVRAVHPLRIVLFGSAARGEMKPDSDLDLLVVMPEGTNQIETAQYLYRHVHCIDYPSDFIVATPAELERHKDNIGLIYYTVLREGKELHAASDMARVRPRPFVYTNVSLYLADRSDNRLTVR